MEGPKTSLQKIELTRIDPYVEQTPGSPIKPQITLPTNQPGVSNNTQDQYRDSTERATISLPIVQQPQGQLKENPQPHRK